MELLIGKGVGQLRFGMTQDEVSALLGEANLKFIDEDDETQLLWEYTDLKIRLSFYLAEGGKLGYIRSSNQNLILYGSSVIDSRIENLKDLIEPDQDLWEIDKYFLFDQYFMEQNWVLLNVEYERVTDIELGVPIGKDDEYLWPN